MFALVITLWGFDQKPKHVTFGLFEAFETIGQALAKSLINLLDEHGLRYKTKEQLKMKFQI